MNIKNFDISSDESGFRNIGASLGRDVVVAWRQQRRLCCGCGGRQACLVAVRRCIVASSLAARSTSTRRARTRVPNTADRKRPSSSTGYDVIVAVVRIPGVAARSRTYDRFFFVSYVVSPGELRGYRSSSANARGTERCGVIKRLSKEPKIEYRQPRVTCVRARASRLVDARCHRAWRRRRRQL